MKESKHWHSLILIFWRTLVVVFFIFTALALLITFPNPILKPLILKVVNARIPGELVVEDIEWNLNHLSLGGVKYTPSPQTPQIKVGRIHIEYKFNEHLEPLLKSAQIADLDLPLKYNNKQGLHIEGIPMYEEDGTASTSYDLPSLHFTNSNITFDTPDGRLELTLDGTASYVQENIILTANGAIASPFVEVKGELSAQGKFPALAGSFNFNEISVSQLFSLPIKGKGEFQATEEEVNIQGEFVNEKVGMSFYTKTHHIIPTSKSSTEISFKLSNIAAALKASVTKFPDLPQISGAVSGNGSFKYENNKVSGGGSIRLSGVSLKEKHYSLDGINAEIALNNIEDFSTPPGQLAQIEKIDSFVPLRNVKLNFQHLGGGRVKIREARANLEKGRLITGSFDFESLDKGTELDLAIKGISAQYLANFSKLSNLDVTGLVDGKMVLQIRDDDFAIKKGAKLWINNPPGVIQYRPDMSQSLPHNIQELTGNENPMHLALIAFWNMHYNTLEVELEKKLDEELKAILHVKGKNPDAFAGHPFEFNINVSGETLRLIKEAIASIE